MTFPNSSKWDHPPQFWGFGSWHELSKKDVVNIYSHFMLNKVQKGLSFRSHKWQSRYMWNIKAASSRTMSSVVSFASEAAGNDEEKNQEGNRKSSRNLPWILWCVKYAVKATFPLGLPYALTHVMMY